MPSNKICYNNLMIKFNTYFNNWLYGDGGYYTDFKQIGKSGDFYTSVSSSKFFGGSIAKKLIKTIEDGFLSEDTTIVEIGAHHGYLIADIIQFIYTLKPELLKTLKEFIYRINSLPDTEFSDENKLLFLFELIETPILKLIHEELIREVNNILVFLIDSKSLQNLDEFLVKFFKILKARLNLYPWTALECIKNIGIRILSKQEVYLTEVLINEIIKFGFQPP